MYWTGDTLPVAELDPGSFLLSGPAMSGKYELLLEFVADGIDRGDGVLFVTTNQGAPAIVRDIESRVGGVPERVLLVDCASEQGTGEGELPEGMVEYVSSPADLTGVGIGVSEQLRRLSAADVDRTRVAFDSLSTLLMYVDVETVFRFLHVLTGRVESIDGLGLYAIDPTTHEEDTVNTVKQLFDGMIELRQGEGTGPEVRVRGVAGSSEDWVSRP